MHSPSLFLEMVLPSMVGTLTLDFLEFGRTTYQQQSVGRSGRVVQLTKPDPKNENDGILKKLRFSR